MSQADLILSGGPIFCGLAEGFAEALAVKDGRVLAVGTAEEIAALGGPTTAHVDLAGRAAMPGLNDAHMHLLPFGLGLSEINLRPETGARSIDEVLRRVAEAAKGKAPGEWVLGRGYDHNELAEKRHPTAEELDRAAPNNPVSIKRTCGHVSVVNTLAMREAGIGHNTPVPDGGMIERRDNKLTGLLAERAQRLVIDVQPKPDVATLIEAIERAGEHMLSQGFTSVMDAAVGMYAGMDEIAAYEEAASTGRLPVRTWVCVYGNPDGIAEPAYAGGYRFGRENGLLRYGAMKVFGDGSAGGLTAAMSQPYASGDPDNYGIFCFSDDEMHGRLKQYHEQGYQLAIHAIGDAAIEQVLSGIEAADSEENPIAGRRHRIEHCGFLTPGQRTRMVAAGIEPVPQPVFVYEFGDLYVDCVGEERAFASYPMRTWLAEGQHPAASSDAPVSTTDPFKNLFTMVTRRTNKGTVINADEAITLEQAIHAYTYCGAYTQFAENEVSRLVPGQLADICVASQDIFAADPAVLEHDVRCDLTVRGGEIVFDRLGQFAQAAQ
ncbi:amidohydrolase [Aureimonas mangrovi]|uniref:amidohydrolase n=1 Tax=Aureimonas mangrovi TaxID=2758041 RepID=UPI00163DCC4A|nr:amidohydrolase [Aureimonas mangrovi]